MLTNGNKSSIISYSDVLVEGCSVAMTKEAVLKKLLAAYSDRYDLDTQTPSPFHASATYYLRDENYLVSRKHVLSALEQHEYVYFFLCEYLDVSTLETQIARSMEVGMSRISPHKEHMSSYVTLIILADHIAPEAGILLQKIKYRKYFRLAFHGWMEYHIAAMEVSTKRFLSNRAGREARRTLELNFGSKGKRKGVQTQ